MTDTEKKPRVYWHNWMGMHRDLEEAKCWTPESELEDLRQYVELAAYDSIAKQLDELKEKLKIAMEALEKILGTHEYSLSREPHKHVADEALARMRGEEK